MGRRLAAISDQPALPHELVVQHQHLVAMGRAEKRGRGRTDEDVAVEAEVLQHVFAVVRVVPEDAGIREREAIVERRARFNQRLREVRDAVKPILEPQAVPVDGRRPVRAVDEAHVDARPLGHVDERARVLPVEAERRLGAAIDGATDRCRHQLQRVAVVEAYARTRLRDWRLGARARPVRRHVRPQGHQRGRHQDAGIHRRRDPAIRERRHRVARVRVVIRGRGCRSAGGCRSRRRGRLEQPGQHERHVMRLHAHRGGGTAQQHAPRALGDTRRRLGAHQHEEPIERDPTDARDARPDFAEAHLAVELRRGGPRHERRGTREGRQVRRLGQLEIDVVQHGTGRRHGQAERRGRRAQPRDAGGEVHARRGQQLDAVEVRVTIARSRGVAGHGLPTAPGLGRQRARRLRTGHPHEECGTNQARAHRPIVCRWGSRLDDAAGQQPSSGVEEHVGFSGALDEEVEITYALCTKRTMTIVAAPCLSPTR